MNNRIDGPYATDRNRNQTALEAAAMNGHAEVVRILIKAGADANARSADGATALIAAAKHGFGDVVQLLLDAHADPDAASSDGTAEAVSTQYPEIQAKLRAARTKEKK